MLKLYKLIQGISPQIIYFLAYNRISRVFRVGIRKFSRNCHVFIAFHKSTSLYYLREEKRKTTLASLFRNNLYFSAQYSHLSHYGIHWWEEIWTGWKDIRTDICKKGCLSGGEFLHAGSLRDGSHYDPYSSLLCSRVL